MKLVPNLTQGTDPWRVWRRDRVGGSDTASILGISPYEDATRESVLAAKVDGVERIQTASMYRGTVLEPFARALYQSRMRCQAPPACVEMDGCPWAGASLDGLCDNGARIASERVQWVLELKAPGWQTHDLALEGVVPEHFAVQIQWQLLVTGLTRCDYASFNPGERFTPASWALPWKQLLEDRRSGRTVPSVEAWPEEWLAVVEVRADPERQAWILEEASQFWFEVAEARAAKAGAGDIKERARDQAGMTGIEAEFA